MKFALLFLLFKIRVDEKISQVANSHAGIVLERSNNLVHHVSFRCGIGDFFPVGSKAGLEVALHRTRLDRRSGVCHHWPRLEPGWADTAIGRGQLSKVAARSSLRNERAWLLQITSSQLLIAIRISLRGVCGWHMVRHLEPDHCVRGFFAWHSHFASYKAHALNRSQQTDHLGTYSIMLSIYATRLISAIEGLLVYYQVPVVSILWLSLVRHQDETAWQLHWEDFSL